MGVIVQKYGGSSVADVGRIREVAGKIAARRAAGHDLVVVVSAMGDTTDELLQLARQVTEAPARRELDMLLTAGERISMALLSMALNALGVPAISFTGSQSGIITNDSHANARIVEVRPYRIQDELAQGRVVIVAGYQGVSYKREVTTLGRGGSDTTAVALAAALEAEACEIYSDVDGVFSADPRVVPQAQKLAEIAYEEMQELAESGARVLNAQAVEFARRAGIVLRARATGGGEGTVVGDVPAAPRVSGVTGEKELVLLRLREAGAHWERLEALLEFLDAAGAPVKEVLASESAGFGAVLLSLENIHGFPALRADLEQRFGGAIACEEGLGAVSVVGVGITADAALLGSALAALQSMGISVAGIHSTSLRLTFLIPADQVPEAVRRLHGEFIAG
jgi:aspartate kinase